MVNFASKLYGYDIRKGQETKTAKTDKRLWRFKGSDPSFGEEFVLGLIERVKEYLNEKSRLNTGRNFCSNPHIELVYEGIELCRKEHGFYPRRGGGSVIDSARRWQSEPFMRGCLGYL